MEFLSFFQNFNQFFALPCTILFFGAALLLTIKVRFLQFRALPRLWQLLSQGFARKQQTDKQGHAATMGSFQALFTAMGTTIGMGNIVGPSLAIVTGGPGALFWLWVYIFFGSVTKFTEVTFAVATRTTTTDGHIVGGPMHYLRSISPFLAGWYSVVITFLFVGWSAVQANTLAQVYAQEGVPAWIVGVALAFLVALVLHGGVQRVGRWASALVPFMCFFYITFACMILFANFGAVGAALQAIFAHALSATAAVGGFVGATMFSAMRSGIFRGIYITEAGLGTSSIAHALTDAQRPTDQGVLALYSMAWDGVLCTLSGMLTLVTGAWISGEFKSTHVYEIFKSYSPHIGGSILLLSITLFVLTTVIGNSFNGTQSFSSLTNHKGVNWYILATMVVIFLGSLMRVQLAWEMMDTFLILVAIPNVIGLVLLAFKRPQVLRV